jgi:hypothetical protein
MDRGTFGVAVSSLVEIWYKGILEAHLERRGGIERSDPCVSRLA